MHICLPTPGNRDLTVTTPSEEPHSAWKLRLGRQFDSRAEQRPGAQRLQSQGHSLSGLPQRLSKPLDTIPQCVP